MFSSVKNIIKRLIDTPGFETRINQVIQRGDCKTALDIGCGHSSQLTRFRPALHTVGLDGFQEALDKSRSLEQHDDYILADILTLDPGEILKRNEGRAFDLVVLMDVIEHLTKREGFELLEKCDRLSCKYIIITTPNGFLEQGPEFGNEYQRHLSGWFPHDFQGLGYKVHGTFGTKLLKGYAGRPRYDFPGVGKCDWVLARLLGIKNRTRWAFSLMAMKDVRGVPARLG